MWFTIDAAVCLCVCVCACFCIYTLVEKDICACEGRFDGLCVFGKSNLFAYKYMWQTESSVRKSAPLST